MVRYIPNCEIIDNLSKCNKSDWILPMGIVAGLNLLKEGGHCNTIFLVDALTLGFKSTIKFSWKYSSIFKKSCIFDVLRLIKYIPIERKIVEKYKKMLKSEIDFYKFLQYEFFTQWLELKEYANEKKIELIGDIPIFVAEDSADVWSNRNLFSIDSKGFPKVVAGVPPDYFSADGQLWGNPLYDWKEHSKTGYDWWTKRIENAFKLCDIVRIDHFRGFESYWEIPFGEKTAVNGKWKKGPKEEKFNVMENKLGKLNIIAEDLGDLTDEVLDLRDELGFPGMKILQFAFDSDEANAYLPFNYETTNCVVYTGTHDNDTTKGWYSKADKKATDYVRRLLNVSGEDIAWDLIRMAVGSVAKYAVIPIQDVMNLGSDARMNTPGKAEDNWQFRFTEDMLTDNMAKGMKYLVKIYNR